MRWVSPLLKGRLGSAMRSENAQPLGSFQNSHCGVTLLTSFLCFYWETCRGKCTPRCPECRKKMDIRAYISCPKEREEYRQHHHHTLFVLLALGSQNPGPMDIEITEELLPFQCFRIRETLLAPSFCFGDVEVCSEKNCQSWSLLFGVTL